MTTAFVLSGGGSLGAVQVGMMQALAERRITPDVLVGASAGALNAAYVAGHGFTDETLTSLASIWRRLRRQDVFPFAPTRHLLALAGARPSLCAIDGLERLAVAHLPYGRLEDAAIPVHVVATEVLSGSDVLLSSGDAARAVMASAAIPAVFPPVELDGRPLFDGGVANNTPISHAVALGADRVVVLPTGYACALPAAPATALASAVHALTLLVQQRLVLDVAAHHDDVELVVLPRLCPLSVSSADFRHAAVLIDRARRTAAGGSTTAVTGARTRSVSCRSTTTAARRGCRPITLEDTPHEHRPPHGACEPRTAASRDRRWPHHRSRRCSARRRRPPRRPRPGPGRRAHS
jgi:NTE family protein